MKRCGGKLVANRRILRYLASECLKEMCRNVIVSVCCMCVFFSMMTQIKESNKM